jgi:hypothetical protein
MTKKIKVNQFSATSRIPQHAEEIGHFQPQVKTPGASHLNGNLSERANSPMV